MDRAGEEYSDGTYANNNIVFRNFTETEDSVGPVLEGLEDTSGATVSTPATSGAIDSPTNTVILTFDKNMMTTGPDSVTDPANYELLDNGTVVPGGISKIDFGMNRGYDSAPANGVTGWVPTNKWEAVLTLDQTLPSGAYSIKVLAPTTTQNGVEDSDGNPLGSNGYTPGRPTVPSKLQYRQQPNAEFEPGARASTDRPIRRPIPIRPTVAVSPNGNYVVVWTAEDQTDPDAGQERVYYQMFDANGAPAEMPLLATSVVQEIQFPSQPTSGDWSLEFNNDPTGLLNSNISASDLQDQLNGLPSIGGTLGSNGEAGHVQVVQGANSWTYFVIFQGGLANTALAVCKTRARIRIRPRRNPRSTSWSQAVPPPPRHRHPFWSTQRAMRS